MAFIQANKLAKAYQSLKGRVERVKEKSEQTIGEVIKTAEVAGTAMACGYANERYGAQIVKEGGPVREYQIAGMAADLAGGVAVKILCLAGAAGKYGEHGGNVADGAIACYAARFGGEMGAKARIVSQQPKQVAAGGNAWAANEWARQAQHAQG